MASSSSLPYAPTRILHQPNSSIAYIFGPRSQGSSDQNLFSLDLSKTIDGNGPILQDLGVTFPATKSTQAYLPILNSDESVDVISGDCSNGEASIRRYTSGNKNTDTQGSWQQGISIAESSGSSSGANILADGISFPSQSNGANATAYLFGGMCPNSGLTDSTWTSDATYSNAMISISQSGSGSQYYASAVNTNQPPVAEAGFTIVPLPSSNQPYIGRQQEFVLIGGHTQAAFINMSQVAVFSLPQNSWTFLPVQQPSDSASTVEPRSGHTAVLNEDHSKIYVFGGWVGDVHTPAQPQLAVLDIGASYGGNGQWTWSVPDMSNTGLTNNASLYGHGATMLSGGIMMIYGGYSISANTTTKRALSSSSQTLLFNTSSNSWISSYQPPASTQQSATQSAAGNNDMAQKIGLAVGLTLGVLILIALIIFYFWYTRRLKRQNPQDERNLMSRSSDGSFVPISQPFLEKDSIDGRGGDMAALNHQWMNADRPRSEMESNSNATGMFVDIPSPTRGLRKGLSQRGYQYHAAPRYDDKRFSRGGSSIHPIAELEDEEERPEHDIMSEAQRQLKEVEEILQSNRNANKADIPDPLRSHPVSPEMKHAQLLPWQKSASAQLDPVKQTTSYEPYRPKDEAAGPSTGRLSPTKTDDRTSSTLSDRSVLSTTSITRTMSTRTGALLAAAGTQINHVIDSSSSSDARTNTMSTIGGRSSPTRVGGLVRSSTNGSSAESGARADAESFKTARSKLPRIPSEEDDLLNSGDQDDPYRRALVANSPQQEYGFASAPRSTQYAARRRNGLLGSLKRAITAMSVDRSMSVASSRGEVDGVISNQSSPTKDRRQFVDGAPRRTVSDGGALLRQKRGKLDWADNPFPPYRDDPDPGDWGEPTRSSIERREAEDEWDVEDAAEKRDVQVMFTVPKSRLRVVNADMDRASLRSVSDGALSRSGSTRVLKREDSRAKMRLKDGDADMREQRWGLDTMVEEQGKDKAL